MFGNYDNWYGVTTKGQQRMITHENLIKWAYENNYQFQVGWSNHFVDDEGTRLVRGDNMIYEARKQGWDDLADLLVAFGFKDIKEG